jgi:membrane peptidoglycan carboxypeptidase
VAAQGPRGALSPGALGPGASPGALSTRALKPAAPLLRRVFLLLGIPTLATAVLLSLPMPELDDFLSDPAGTRITDRTGSLLAVVPGNGGAFQVRVGPGGITRECQEIFIRLEDARFRRHPGVDPLAVLRALADKAASPAARSGASTITMQLARLVEPRARSVAGKLVEAWWALRIESRLTKDRILAAYLDAVPFGRNTRGVGAAAWTYFGTDLAHLSRKLALLAVIMTARHWNAGFVWNAQSPHAKSAGIPEAVIEAIRIRKTPSFTDPAEQAVYRLFSEMYAHQQVDDATYAAADKELGAKGLVEILNVAGFYGVIASIVNVTGVALRPGQAHPFA